MIEAAEAVRRGLLAALSAQPELAEVQVYGGEIPSGVLPRIEIGEASGSDWGAKEMPGRELRTAVIVRVASGQAERLAALTGAVERAGETVARELDGWRVASAVLLRSRGSGGRSGERVMTIEHRIR